MTLARIPAFVWAVLVTAIMILFAFTALLVATVLLELDRKVGTAFFDPERGGDPLLWQHLFWIFGHPEVYIMFLPATGIISSVVVVHARQRLAGYPWVVAAIAATGLLSFGLWLHHMFTTGVPVLAASFFGATSFTIAIASGVQVFAWIATIWQGRIRWTPPMLYLFGFLIIFVAGGLTGVMVAAVPFDQQVHDSFFIVAHFHYVLIGGVVFPAFAGLHHWLPKITGRVLDARLGAASFWLTFVGFNLAFFPMHVLGLIGMPRRIQTYQGDLGWNEGNMLATVGAFVLALGFLLVLVNVVASLRRGAAAPDDPWQGDTLEWSVPSPPPPSNFATIPTVGDRHPLWIEQRDTDPAAAAMTTAPATWRASLGTSILDAVPEQLVQHPMPTFTPLVAAAGLLGVFLGILADARSLAILGGLVLAAGAVGWLRSSIRDQADADAAPLVVPGLRAARDVAWWGAALTVVVLVASVSHAVFSYFVLRAEWDGPWPQGDLEAPGLLLPLIATGALALGAPAVVRAVRRLLAGDVGAGIRSMSVGVLASGAALTLLLWQMLGAEASHRDNAYASAVFTLAGWQAAAFAASLLAGVVAVWRGLSAPPHRALAAARVASTLWFGAALTWLLVLITVHLSPAVT